jgi:potassium efflux system protein
VFTALPIALFVAVCFGYYYTALKLSDRLINTLYLLMFWLVIEATSCAAWASPHGAWPTRALAKRQAAKEAGEGEAVIEEPTLDIEQVNEQSMRLIRLALLGGFIAALYWVWSDLISVFSYLDNVTLYEYTSGTGANQHGAHQHRRPARRADHHRHHLRPGAQPARPAGSAGAVQAGTGPGQRLPPPLCCPM